MLPRLSASNFPLHGLCWLKHFEIAHEIVSKIRRDVRDTRHRPHHVVSYSRYFFSWFHVDFSCVGALNIQNIFLLFKNHEKEKKWLQAVDSVQSLMSKSEEVIRRRLL